MTGDQERRRSALRKAAENGRFESVVFGNHFWIDDPFDVPQVHEKVRASFKNLLHVARGGSNRRLMVVRGSVGAGKTHLLRALRSIAATQHEALCAYAQFDTSRTEFDQHALAELVASLEKPVYGSEGAPTGFVVTNDAVWNAAPAISGELDQIWEDADYHAIARLVARAADRVMDVYKLPDEHLHTVKALILANAPLSSVRTRAKQFLRGEPLTEVDRDVVPDLPQRHGPPNYVDQLFSLATVLGKMKGQFVYFFDQAESLNALGQEAAEKALTVIRLLLETVHDVAIVIAWERNAYGDMMSAVSQNLVDRFREGAHEVLDTHRTEDEVRAIVQKRLEVILKEADVALDPENPLDPLPADFPVRIGPVTARNALYKARCLIAGEEDKLDSAPESAADQSAEEMDGKWKAALSTAQNPQLTDSEFVSSIAWAVAGDRVGPSGAKGTLFWRDLDLDSTARLRLFGFTKDPRGGGLHNQAKLAASKREGRLPIGLRNGRYPGSFTKTGGGLQEVFSGGGLRIVVSDDDIRTIVAYRAFSAAHGTDPGFADWAKRVRVLGGLDVVQKIRAAAGAPAPVAAPRTPVVSAPVSAPPSASAPTFERRPAPEPDRTEPQTRVGNADEILIGAAPSRKDVRLPLRNLTRHMVALGGSGSGKTTLILRIVEQALLRGVPAILVDRKGDFAAYADPQSWAAIDGAEGAELRRRIAVSLYTPGKMAGRRLALRLLPDDFSALDAEDRDEAARAAADGLAQMIGLKETQKDLQRREVLKQALDRLGGRAEIDLPRLIEVLNDDPELAAALTILDPDAKHRKALIPMIEQLRLSRGALFAEGGDPLDFGELILPVDGRTRLSVISLAFLPEVGDQQFFVSRLLAEARRFCRSRPSAELQSLLVLDEADMYMPALSKPATKEPMLDLLRRARSGGLGLVLGTQSPGDLDYKGRDNITTWALGRIQDGTALNKVAFVGEGSPLDVRATLPQFGAGRFLLRSETTGLCEVQARPSLMRTSQVPEEDIIRLAKSSE